MRLGAVGWVGRPGLGCFWSFWRFGRLGRAFGFGGSRLRRVGRGLGLGWSGVAALLAYLIDELESASLLDKMQYKH